MAVEQVSESDWKFFNSFVITSHVIIASMQQIIKAVFSLKNILQIRLWYGSICCELFDSPFICMLIGWVVMYPEGSRLFLIQAAEKRYCAKERIEPFKHCTHPRYVLKLPFPLCFLGGGAGWFDYHYDFLNIFQLFIRPIMNM